MLVMISYILKSYTSLSCVILYFRKKKLNYQNGDFLSYFSITMTRHHDQGNL